MEAVLDAFYPLYHGGEPISEIGRSSLWRCSAGGGVQPWPRVYFKFKVLEDEDSLGGDRHLCDTLRASRWVAAILHRHCVFPNLVERLCTTLNTDAFYGRRLLDHDGYGHFSAGVWMPWKKSPNLLWGDWGNRWGQWIRAQLSDDNSERGWWVVVTACMQQQDVLAIHCSHRSPGFLGRARDSCCMRVTLNVDPVSSGT